jgi:hypothetical protein
MRPLLMSGIPLDVDVERIDLDVFSAPQSRRLVPPTPTPDSMAVVKKETTALAKPCKPWLYSLPAFLRPQPGTTYEMMYGDGLPTPTPQRVWTMQAVLYGLPNPERRK